MHRTLVLATAAVALLVLAAPAAASDRISKRIRHMSLEEKGRPAVHRQRQR